MVAKSVCLFSGLAGFALASSFSPLPTGDPAVWRASQDGGNAPSVSLGEPFEGRPSLRFAYVNVRGYGNASLDVASLPPDAYGVRFKMRVEAAEPEAAMHLWFREKDGDMWMCPIHPEDGKRIAENRGGWRDVFVPLQSLTYQPRGDKRRSFMSVDRLLLGFNFGSQTVCVAGLAFVVRSGRLPPAAAPGPVDVPKDPAGSRIAILDEPTVEKLPGHADPQRLARLLRSEGFSPCFLRAADLCDPSRLTRQSVDLLVLPCAPFFPRAAAEVFRSFLKAGGSFFSIGGYAFDRLCGLTENGWEAQAQLPVANELDTALSDPVVLNTRHGGQGDTMKLHPDQIGVFDPSFLLRNVTSAAFATDQYVVPETWRAACALEGVAAVAMTGNNSPVFPVVHGRWIPLVETYDRLGRPRGPAAALVLNHRGLYKGSNWGFTGITNRDLFDGGFPEMDRLFVAACRRLLAPSYLVTLKCGFASYRPGETASLTATVWSGAKAKGALTVRFSENETVIAEVPVKDGCAAATWRVEAAEPDFRDCSALLLVDGQPVDLLRSAFTVWNPARLAEGPALALRDNYFEFNGRPLFFGGANTTGMMWYSDNEDPHVWRRDFERMGDFALNTLRILHFSPFCNEAKPESRVSSKELVSRPEKLRRQTDALVQLAQPNQISVFLSLHDWLPLDLSDGDLAAQQDWNRFWAGRYASVASMLYDIQNEPGTTLGNAAVLRPLYETWLAGRHGSLQAAYAAWQGSGAKPEIDFAARAAGWADLRARDNERFRAWVYARWQRANGEAVKAAAPQAPVTVGHLQDQTASEKVLDTRGLDFVNIHHYGAVDHLRGILKLVDRRFEGKSFSLGEFGSKAAHSARNSGHWGDPAEASVSHYLAVGHSAFGMGASFIANWSWKDFRDSVFPWGVNHADLTPKPVLEAYRNMLLLFRTAEPRYETPQAWLVLPDSFRFGAETGRIHEALRRSADWLLRSNVAFGVINEESLDRLPRAAKALVWPLPTCPADAAFERVARFVEQGGSLLLTGDPRFDESRKPTRPDRLEKLGFPSAGPAPEAPFTPCKWPADVTFSVSQNKRVVWLRPPLELLDESGAVGCALYRRFLDEVSGVARIKTSVDDGSLPVFEVALRNGRALLAVNTAQKPQQVVLPARAGCPEVRAEMAAGRTLYVQLDARGEVRAAAAQGGVTVGGQAVLAGTGDVGALSLTDEGLGRSAQVAVMPFGAGALGLVRAADAPRLSGEVGEFRAGRWTALERQALEAKDGVLRAESDAATAYDLRLLSGEGLSAAAAANMERLLRVRR